MKLLRNYFAVAMGYGAAHKLVLLWNADVETYTKIGKTRRPMLMGEKLSAFALGMVYSPLLSPVWLMTDLDYLDMYMSGKKPSDYGYGQERSSTFDYVMG